ncbi:MAG: hypothetical protein U1E27_06440, partial [Kiritimatiellia bacterium]|nr:hypothetical protein [Kiritimatiellia bacterium]
MTKVHRFTSAFALCLFAASCGRTDISQKGSAPADSAGSSSPQWTTLLPGIVRGDQGTMEITVQIDRPQREFGNNWEFLIQVVPGKVIGEGANTLLGIFVPPEPDGGLVALIRTGKNVVRAQARNWECTPGKPMNLAVSWGKSLTLWCDGKPLATTAMTEFPEESLWPADVAINRFAPFHPAGIRISSIERVAGTLDADPLKPFIADADTTLLAGADLRPLPVAASRWQRESGYAVAKPAWYPEEQCLGPQDPAVFPVVVANHGAESRTAHLEWILTPLSGDPPIPVLHDLPIAPGTPATLVRVELPELKSDWYQVAWKISGEGLPTLDGASSIAVYPRDPEPADGALARFYAVHRPETWSNAPFSRMGVSATRAWALSRIFHWNRIEPTPGNFSWEQADAYVDSCLADGQEILAVLGYPSRWAAIEPSEEHKAKHELAYRPERWQPADLEAWARYVRAVAERYKGRIRHYEVYNEVNFCPPGLPATFSGGVPEYLALQRIAYREIKAADPQAGVTSSGFSADVNKAMPMEALRGGLAEWCDIFNVHGYSGVEGTAEWVADWRTRRPGAPVWQTEQMWHQLSDDRRRWWLTAALPLQYAADGYERFYNMGVDQMFFDRATRSPTRDQWVVAVMNNELRPCTGFSALLKGAAEKLDMRHRFARSDGSWLTVLGSERGPMAVTLSAQPQRIRDVFGRPLTATPAASGFG